MSVVDMIRDLHGRGIQNINKANFEQAMLIMRSHFPEWYVTNVTKKIITRLYPAGAIHVDHVLLFKQVFKRATIDSKYIDVVAKITEISADWLLKVVVDRLRLGIYHFFTKLRSSR